MIEIDRGPEPPVLLAARRRHLSRQLLGRQQGTPPAIEGYECARSALYLAQSRKCIYCERYTGEKGEPVEHFRPKKPYWWLSWTWSNLFFICQSCNTGYKGSEFPLAPGTAPLPAPPAGVLDDQFAVYFDLRAESPLLIDPGSEDPLEHIEWRPENPDASDRPRELLWRPFYKTARGKQTIDDLGLRGTLVDHVSDYLRDHVVGRLERLWRDCDRGAVSDMHVEWEALLRDISPHTAMFRAATYDALRFLVPRWFRERWGLRHPPRPGVRGRSAPQAPVFLDPPFLAGLPSALRLELRAELLPTIDLLEKLWPLRAWSHQELAEVLDVAKGTIAKALRALRRAGRLPVLPLAP